MAVYAALFYIIIRKRRYIYKSRFKYDNGNKSRTLGRPAIVLS